MAKRVLRDKNTSIVEDVGTNGYHENGDEDKENGLRAAKIIENAKDSDGRSNQESNEIRQAYRNLCDAILDERVTAIDPRSELVDDALDKVEKTFLKVQKPREAVSDNKALLEIARLGKERIKNVHCEFRAFNNNEFMDRLKKFMSDMDPRVKRDVDNHADEDEENSDEEIASTNRRDAGSKSLQDRYVLTRPILAKFGQVAMSHFRLPPRPTFLLGSLDKEPGFKKARLRKAPVVRDDTAKQTKIKELKGDEEDEIDQNSTVNEIERIFKILKRIYLKHDHAPICLFEFMINPRSFSRTIENIFYVSFLVKDGYAQIKLDDDQLPVIEPMLENEPNFGKSSEVLAKKKANQTYIQSMISMTKLEWRELVEVFEIEEALIPEPKESTKKK